MRHQKKTLKLGRTAEHRKALLANQVCSLIQHQRIKTPLRRKKSQPRKLVWKRRNRKSGDGSAKSRVTRGNNLPSNYANVSDKSCSVDEDWAFKSGGFPKSGARLGFSLVI